jgi:hypothetical protein
MLETDTSKRSSTFSKVSYDPAKLAMTLYFKSGHTRTYANVTPQTHASFIGSKSLGNAYNKTLWGRPNEHPSS